VVQKVFEGGGEENGAHEALCTHVQPFVASFCVALFRPTRIRVPSVRRVCS